MHVLAKLAIASATLGLGFGVHLLGLKPATAAPTIFDFKVTWDDSPTTMSTGWFKVDLANPFYTHILDDEDSSTVDPFFKAYNFLDFYYQMNGVTYGLADVGTGSNGGNILNSGVFHHYNCAAATIKQACHGYNWFQEMEFYLNPNPASPFDNGFDDGSVYAGRTPAGSFGEAWSNNGVNQAIQVTLRPRKIVLPLVPAVSLPKNSSRSSAVSTPEPTLILGLAAVGATAAIAKSRRLR
jgi:hypothetical protein